MIWKHILGRRKSAPGPKLSKSDPSPQGSSLDLTELEDRILMSATPMAPDVMPDADLEEPVDVDTQLDGTGQIALTDAVAADGQPASEAEVPLSETTLLLDDATIDAAESALRHELVFVDTSVDGYEELLDHIIDSQDDSTNLEIFELDSVGDGVDQISKVLERYDELDAVHVVSHGNEGSLRLGDVWLGVGQMQAYAGDIAQWHDAFAVDGDLLLYGCNLAATPEGLEFLEGLHELTGADVTASIDPTGHASLGGDWDLEFTIGTIESDLILSAEAQQLWTSVLPTEWVFDGFETHNYSGSHGSADWVGDWQEVGDDNDWDDDAGGHIYVAHYDLDAFGSHCLEIEAVAGVGIYRQIDLGDASSAQLEFDYQRHDSNGFLGSTLQVQVFDGSSWNTIHTIGSGFDPTPQGVNLNITPYMASDTKIRFLSTGDGSGSIFLDHIEVTYEENFAPVLQAGGSLTLSTIQEDAFNNGGNTVAQIISSAGDDRITDSNTGALEGIAVIDVDDGNGKWQFDALADGNWQDFGSVSNSSAVLLGPDSKIRFVPDADYNGSGGNIEFRAWDQTDGDVGDTGVSVLSNGGSEPFSASTDFAGITVDAVNDAPELTLPADKTVDEDTSLLLSGISIADVDADPDVVQVTLSVGDGKLTFGSPTNLSFSDGDGIDDDAMTFTGTVGDINAALATLSYQGNQDFNGTDTLNLSVNDQGNNGTGGILSDSGSFDITVDAVNDAPELTLPADKSVDEDTSLLLSGISIADVDADPDVVQVTLSVADGKLTFGSTTNLSFSDGDGTDDASMTFTGTVGDINAALATLSYQGNQDFNGTDTLNLSVNDQGNNGTGGILSDSGSFDITVDAVNDAPELTLPADKTVDEDTSLLLSGISIADVDADPDVVQVTLTVGDGKLTFGSTTNLSFSDGDGTDDASMTFTGTVGDINAALATLSYQGNQDFNGTDTLNLSVNDQGNNGTGGILSDSGSFDITVDAVNDAPELTLPADKSVDEDTSLLLSGISIADVDADPDVVQVTLTVGDGKLTFGSTTNLSFSDGDGTDDASMTFTGTVGDINAALATLSYQGNQDFNGTDTLNLSVNDQGNNGTGGILSDSGSFDITVDAVNDAPELTLPADKTVDEDTSLLLSGISIADVDADPDVVQVTLTVGDGKLTFGSTTNLSFSDGDGTDDASMTFTGTVGDINAALATLSYQGNQDFNGTDTLNLSVNDQGNNGTGGILSDSGSFDITVDAVNDAPELTLPADKSVDEDTSLLLSGISIADVDADPDAVQVTLSVGDGKLTFGSPTNLSFSDGNGTDDASMTFTGTVGDINAALATLSYQGNQDFNGTDTLNLSVNDQGNNGTGGILSDSGSFDITVDAVNDAPELTLPADKTVDEDTSLLLSGISIADVDADPDVVQVTLSVTDGKLTFGSTTNLSFSDGDGTDDASMTFTGTVGDINAALATLSYQGNQDFNGTDTLNLSVNDQGNNGTGGILSDSGSFDITVDAVNDAPELTLPADKSVDEDTSLLLSGISIADVDADPDVVQVTLSVADGKLTFGSTTNLSFSDGDGTDDASMTFTGTVGDINAALATLSYQGNQDFNGTDTLNLSVNDQGNNGTGGILSDSGSFDITVDAVNDAPELTLPADKSVDEDTSLLLSGISIADVDADPDVVQVTLSVADGKLTFGSTTNLSFSDGDGTDDASMTFTGTVGDINAALATLSYQGNQDFNGTDTLNLSVNDQGNNGTGGILSDSGSFDITVDAVNDAPELTLPADKTVDEDTSLLLSGISIADVDADPDVVQVTLTVGDGKLTFGSPTNLSFSDGDGIDDASMTFTGTVGDINAALATLSYQGNQDFNGTDTLNLSVNDQGNNGTGGILSDSGSFDITVDAVNDAPELTLPADKSVDEDTSLLLSGISIADVDADPDVVQVTLTVGDGKLTFGSTTNLSFSDGDGIDDASMTFTGTVGDINAALATLSYQGNQDFNGTDTLNLSVNDQGNNGTGGILSDSGSFDITVDAVNDAPELTLPADKTVDEDTSLLLSGISIADVDADPDVVQVTLTVGDGKLTFGSTTNLSFSDGDGIDDASMTFTGTVGDINAALATLSYQGNQDFNGTDTLNLSVNDQGNNGTGGILSDSGSFDITVDAVNDAPELTLPADKSVDEDTSLLLSGISITGVDEVEVTVSVTDGKLTFGSTTNLTFSDGDGTDDATMTFTGTVGDINSALATLSYQGNQDFNGTDTLNLSVSDSGDNSLSDSGSFDITVDAVNDAPELTLPADKSVDEDTSLLLSGISIADVDADTDAVEVTLSVTDGKLTFGSTTNLSFSDGDGTDDASMTFTGTVGDINAALATLSYQGNQDFNGTDTLNLSVNDQGNNGTGGILSDSGSFDITVRPVNDAPTSSGIPDIKVDEDSSPSLVNLRAAFDDVEDLDENLTYSIVDVSNPDLFDDVLINPTLDILVIRYAPDMNGTTEITVKAEDTEGLWVTETFTVEVVPVNDAPVGQRDKFTVRGDETLNVAPSGILNNDSDVEGDKLRAVLVRGPKHGELILNPDGSFQYIPDPSFIGKDNFVYVAWDGEDVSERVRVVIKVLAPTSPVDTDPGDTGAETDADNSGDAQSNEQVEQLSELVHAELPEGFADSNADVDSPTRERHSLKVDHSSDADSLDTEAQAYSLGSSSHSSGWRTTSRTQNVGDLEEYLAPVEIGLSTTNLVLPTVSASTVFGDLDELNIVLEEEDALHRLMVNSAFGVATSLTVGYVFWTVRAGYLLTSLIAQMPAWRMVDPLPILNSLDSNALNTDGESLESIAQSSPIEQPA